jgi:hypothetical protein
MELTVNSHIARFVLNTSVDYLLVIVDIYKNSLLMPV